MDGTLNTSAAPRLATGGGFEGLILEQVLSHCLQCQLPGATWTSTGGTPSTWAPASLWEAKIEVLVQPGIVPAVAVTWGGDHCI